jgi:hypothetical protein
VSSSRGPVLFGGTARRSTSLELFFDVVVGALTRLNRRTTISQAIEQVES